MRSPLFSRAVFCAAVVCIALVRVAPVLATTPWSATVNGIVVNFGIVPSALARDWLAPHGAGRDPHGRNIASANDHHFLVSIFDAKTEKAISDVEVSATYKFVGSPSVTKVLEPMRIGDTTTFGNFFSDMRINASSSRHTA